jgi:hypothetical protein
LLKERLRIAVQSSRDCATASLIAAWVEFSNEQLLDLWAFFSI